MKHTESLTRYVAAFVDELAANGVRHAVISPGSRSTPLAMMITAHAQLKEWVVIDERSAAFFAHGLAKQTKNCVALVCSSGTAAANYYPAIVEAKQSRVPLLVLTADRPHELRDVGAPQAIDQLKMYGSYVKWFHEMALPETSGKMLEYVRGKAAQAIDMATTDNAGPVHLNFPFREPLLPDLTLSGLWGNEQRDEGYTFAKGQKLLSDDALTSILNQLTSKQRGLIVCGPQTDKRLATAVFALAKAWHLPVIADPLSQLRTGSDEKPYIIDSYDAFLRDDEIRQILSCDFIIRFGAMPVSKPYLFYLQEQHAVSHYIVEAEEGYREPTSKKTHFIHADPVSLCYQLQQTKRKKNAAWLQTWQEMDKIAKNYLIGAEQTVITEGTAIQAMAETIPNHCVLYSGNSMAIRDIDSFFLETSKDIKILANRGANGIDGVISSAAGAAAAGNPVTLVIGDLSFYHDMNGLLAAKHYNLNLTILLINNNGGGIFSFLPQASDEKYFEALFGTPLDIDFRHTAALYGCSYMFADDQPALQQALMDSQAQSGLSIIEIKTDRVENTAWHRDIWENVIQAIKSHDWPEDI